MLGFEARSESIWDVVGTAESRVVLLWSRNNSVSAVVCEFRWSQHEILKLLKRWRYRNFGKWWRAKKSETSILPNVIDSTLLCRIPSSSGVNEEMTAVAVG